MVHTCGICGRKEIATDEIESLWNPSVCVLSDDFDFDDDDDSAAGSSKWVEIVVCDECDAKIQIYVIREEDIDNIRFSRLKKVAEVDRLTPDEDSPVNLEMVWHFFSPKGV